MFDIKGQKNLDGENFGNLFETLVTLISKWPGISKIYPPILNYRMLCVLSNNLSVFDSSQGTPCTYNCTQNINKVIYIPRLSRLVQPN